MFPWHPSLAGLWKKKVSNPSDNDKRLQFLQSSVRLSSSFGSLHQILFDFQRALLNRIYHTLDNKVGKTCWKWLLEFFFKLFTISDFRRCLNSLLHNEIACCISVCVSTLLLCCVCVMGNKGQAAYAPVWVTWPGEQLWMKESIIQPYLP